MGLSEPFPELSEGISQGCEESVLGWLKNFFEEIFSFVQKDWQLSRLKNITPQVATHLAEN
jgi:hypothetical protein